jgi:hypothetical protein
MTETVQPPPGARALESARLRGYGAAVLAGIVAQLCTAGRWSRGSVGPGGRRLGGEQRRGVRW